MSDELQKGDWVVVTPWKRLAIQHCGGVFKFGEHTKYHYVGKTEPERVASLWGCGILTPLNAIRLATPAEIAAATGQPQEEKIEVGDVVEFMRFEGAPTPVGLGKQLVVLDIRTNDDWGEHWGGRYDSVWCKDYRWPLKFCRLVSKGKSGQGKGTLPKEPVKLDDPVKRTGAPCPACSGSIHGPGRIADWSDNPIACPRCQYGKPKPEPVIAKPYHKVLPSGECVVAAMTQAYYQSGEEADQRGVQARAEATFERLDAAKNLEKAQAEARRLGIL